MNFFLASPYGVGFLVDLEVGVFFFAWDLTLPFALGLASFLDFVGLVLDFAPGFASVFVLRDLDARGSLAIKYQTKFYWEHQMTFAKLR